MHLGKKSPFAKEINEKYYLDKNQQLPFIYLASRIVLLTSYFLKIQK